MATLDFSPLFRSSIGFDQMPALFSSAVAREDGGYPPYNIEKCGEDQYRIVLALAGWGADDIEIVHEESRLSVRGQKPDTNGTTYLHQGIAARSFLRQFDLADYVKVMGATMGDGLLIIDLKRELPERLKPRKIPIGTGLILPVGQKGVAKPRQTVGAPA